MAVVNGTAATVAELRRNAADILRLNRDDFRPFLSNPKTGEQLSDVEYENYCQDLAEKPVWGGQVPIFMIICFGEQVFRAKNFILNFLTKYYPKTASLPNLIGQLLTEFLD
jgi:hypothetical protein